MKKHLRAFLCILLAFVMIIPLASCSDKAKSVKVDDETYHTVYLYTFKDANIDDLKDTGASYDNNPPSSSGYVYSIQELSAGDSIRVWTQHIRKDMPQSSFDPNRDLGTAATIDKLVKTYFVKVSKRGDTYTITYYELPENNTFSSKETLEKLEQKEIQVVEVITDRVSIVYE